MMGWLSNIFMNSNAADKAVDAAINTGDKLFYTAEERAESRAKMRDWYLKLLDSMSPFNVAMRLLAFVVAAVWALMVVAITGFMVAGVFMCAPSDEFCRPSMAAEGLESLANGHITPYFAMIMAFYFGAAGINGAIRTFKGKNS